MVFQRNKKSDKDELKSKFQSLKKKQKQSPEEERLLVYENVKKTEKSWKQGAFSFAERMTEELRMPPDVIKGNPVIHMLGARHLVIENYKKLVEYKDDCIRVLSGIGTIHVSGGHLRISYYTKDEIKIEGHIIGVEVRQ